MPISMASAPASATARTASRPVRRSPPVMYGRAACGPRRARPRRCCLERADVGPPASEPRMSITWATSLSPRPDRFTQHGLARPASAPSRDHPGERVRRLERGDDALGAGQQLEGVEHLGVGDRLVLGPADGGQVARARGRRPGSRARPRSTRLLHLAVLVLHQVAAHAVHDAGHAVADGGAAGRLDADQLGVGVGEAGEDARSRSSRRRRRRRRRRDRRRVSARHCSRASSPITRWSSRTIHGYGCGPITEPRQ